MQSPTLISSPLQLNLPRSWPNPGPGVGLTSSLYLIPPLNPKLRQNTWKRVGSSFRWCSHVLVRPPLPTTFLKSEVRLSIFSELKYPKIKFSNTFPWIWNIHIFFWKEWFLTIRKQNLKSFFLISFSLSFLSFPTLHFQDILVMET